MSKELTVIDYKNPQVIDTLRNTVALGANDAELAMFCSLCESTGLNPFKKEIWFIKTPEKSWVDRNTGERRVVPARVQIMTGINGFFQIANKNPNYDGMDEPEFVETPDGLPVRCTVRVYRKDRSRPQVAVARFKEFFPGPSKSGKENWDLRPFHMLAKVAKAIALREAFPQELNGLFTEDEITQPTEAVEVVEPKRSRKGAKTIEAPPLEDDAPKWLVPSDDPLQHLRDAIDGEDWLTVGNHVIETKCSLQGMSVLMAAETRRATLAANLKRFKSEADRLAVAAYLEAFPGVGLLPAEDVTITEEDLQPTEVTNGQG